MKRLLFVLCAVASAETRIPMRVGNLDCTGFPSHTGIHIVCQDLGAKKILPEGDLKVPDKLNESVTFLPSVRFDIQQWTVTRGADANHWDVVTSAGDHANGVLP